MFKAIADELVGPNAYKRRVKVCQRCEHNSDIGVCKLCGCFTRLKAKLKKEKCPKDKWDS